MNFDLVIAYIFPKWFMLHKNVLNNFASNIQTYLFS
jgi:hypothetical protein